MKRKTNYTLEAERTADKYKKIQAQVAHADKANPKKKSEKPMQAGGRKYPEPPMIRQHLRKPGKESDLILQPMYMPLFTKVQASWMVR